MMGYDRYHKNIYRQKQYRYKIIGGGPDQINMLHKYINIDTLQSYDNLPSGNVYDVEPFMYNRNRKGYIITVEGSENKQTYITLYDPHSSSEQITDEHRKIEGHILDKKKTIDSIQISDKINTCSYITFDNIYKELHPYQKVAIMHFYGYKLDKCLYTINNTTPARYEFDYQSPSFHLEKIPHESHSIALMTGRDLFTGTGYVYNQNNRIGIYLNKLPMNNIFFNKNVTINNITGNSWNDNLTKGENKLFDSGSKVPHAYIRILKEKYASPPRPLPLHKNKQLKNCKDYLAELNNDYANSSGRSSGSIINQLYAHSAHLNILLENNFNKIELPIGGNIQRIGLNIICLPEEFNGNNIAVHLTTDENTENRTNCIYVCNINHTLQFNKDKNINELLHNNQGTQSMNCFAALDDEGIHYNLSYDEYVALWIYYTKVPKEMHENNKYISIYKKNEDTGFKFIPIKKNYNNVWSIILLSVNKSGDITKTKILSTFDTDKLEYPNTFYEYEYDYNSASIIYDIKSIPDNIQNEQINFDDLIQWAIDNKSYFLNYKNIPSNENFAEFLNKLPIYARYPDISNPHDFLFIDDDTFNDIIGNIIEPEIKQNSNDKYKDIKPSKKIADLVKGTINDIAMEIVKIDFRDQLNIWISKNVPPEEIMKQVQVSTLQTLELMKKMKAQIEMMNRTTLEDNAIKKYLIAQLIDAKKGMQSKIPIDQLPDNISYEQFILLMEKISAYNLDKNKLDTLLNHKKLNNYITDIKKEFFNKYTMYEDWHKHHNKTIYNDPGFFNDWVQDNNNDLNTYRSYYKDDSEEKFKNKYRKGTYHVQKHKLHEVTMIGGSMYNEWLATGYDLKREQEEKDKLKQNLETKIQNKDYGSYRVDNNLNINIKGVLCDLIRNERLENDNFLTTDSEDFHNLLPITNISGIKDISFRSSKLGFGNYELLYITYSDRTYIGLINRSIWSQTRILLFNKNTPPEKLSSPLCRYNEYGFPSITDYIYWMMAHYNKNNYDGHVIYQGKLELNDYIALEKMDNIFVIFYVKDKHKMTPDLEVYFFNSEKNKIEVKSEPSNIEVDTYENITRVIYS